MTKTVNYTMGGPVNSSALNYYWYNDNTLELYVRFHNGTIAGYYAVPPYRVKEMLQASSIGSYFATNIKGRYTGTDGNVEFKNEAPKKGSYTTAPVQAKKRYRVGGNVLKPVATYVEANSFEEAIAQFLADNKDAEVTSVAVA